MPKARIIDGKHLVELRKATGLTQKEFAKAAAVSVDSLRSFERGRRALTTERFRLMKLALGYEVSNRGRLRVMIDYLRITFKEVRNLAYFCQTFLNCDLKEFTSNDTRLMTYSHLWRRGDIWIFDYFDKEVTKNYQITLQLSGQGCRQMELILEKHGLTWYDLLQKMVNERSDMKVTRLDIAMDELYRGYGHEHEQFHLVDMIAKVYQKEVVFDHLRTWNHIGGGGLKFENREEIAERSQGISIYFGSRQSNLYFNFYEKRYELARKEGLSLAESLEIFGIWNRYELRFSQTKANEAIKRFVEGTDLAEIAKGVVNAEMQVYDRTNQYGAFLPDKKWQALFGGTEKLKLSVRPEPYNIGRTIKWLLHQVSDSLALVEEADKIMDTKYLEMILDTGCVNERGELILKNIQADVLLKKSKEST